MGIATSFWQDVSLPSVVRLPYKFAVSQLYTWVERERQRLNCIAQGTHYSEPSHCSNLELFANSSLANPSKTERDVLSHKKLALLREEVTVTV